MQKDSEISYWKELFPLWGTSFTSWFGWGTMKQTITTLVIIVGVLICLLLLGQEELLIGEVVLRGLAITMTGGWAIFVSVVSFINANHTLYNNQKKVVDERLPGQLAIKVERQSGYYYNNENNKNALAIIVTNLEQKRKIIELQALINFDHFYYDSNRQFASHSAYGWNAPLFWMVDKDYPTEIELRPKTPATVILAELLDFLSTNLEPVMVVRFGINPLTIGHSFEDESIYWIKITFQGKLEGEYDFKTFHCEYMFYSKPAEQKLSFLDEAEKIYPDISRKLLERAKRVMKYDGKKLDA